MAIGIRGVPPEHFQWPHLATAVKNIWGHHWQNNKLYNEACVTIFMGRKLKWNNFFSENNRKGDIHSQKLGGSPSTLYSGSCNTCINILVPFKYSFKTFRMCY